MGGKAARERLERAERVARQVWQNLGVKCPDAGQLAMGILAVLEDDELFNSIEEDGHGNARKDADDERA